MTTPTEHLIKEVDFLLALVADSRVKLNIIRGENEGAPPDSLEERLKRAVEGARAESLTSPSNLIKAGALRQYRHNDGSDGFVFAYDKAITDRVFALTIGDWKDAYENMKKFAEDNGLDTTARA